MGPANLKNVELSQISSAIGAQRRLGALLAPEWVIIRPTTPSTTGMRNVWRRSCPGDPQPLDPHGRIGGTAVLLAIDGEGARSSHGVLEVGAYLPVACDSGCRTCRAAGRERGRPPQASPFTDGICAQVSSRHRLRDADSSATIAGSPEARSSSSPRSRSSR